MRQALFGDTGIRPFGELRSRDEEEDREPERELDRTLPADDAHEHAEGADEHEDDRDEAIVSTGEARAPLDARRATRRGASVRVPGHASKLLPSGSRNRKAALARPLERIRMSSNAPHRPIPSAVRCSLLRLQAASPARDARGPIGTSERREDQLALAFAECRDSAEPSSYPSMLASRFRSRAPETIPSSRPRSRRMTVGCPRWMRT